MSELAVVTGASRGIGRAVAHAFAKRELRVALLARGSESLDSVASEVSSLGGEARAIPCDVSKPEEVDAAAELILRELGTPWCVVHNAGIVRRGRHVEDTPIESWDEVVAVNLRGPFLLTRRLLPAMRQAGRGRFVSVSSISGTIGCAGAASYAASKWGLIGFAKSLAEELRGTGLSSLCVLPGSVDTEMLVGSGFAPDMSPDDVAGTVVYAALDAPSAMNGSAIEMFG